MKDKIAIPRLDEVAIIVPLKMMVGRKAMWIPHVSLKNRDGFTFNDAICVTAEAAIAYAGAYIRGFEAGMAEHKPKEHA